MEADIYYKTGELMEPSNILQNLHVIDDKLRKYGKGAGGGSFYLISN